MVRTRVIPCLLLRNMGLVKTRRFKDPVYVGDPINAVRIFNDKEVDELVFLDITATIEGKRPPFELLAKVASQCFMPLCYGGGVRTIEDMARLYSIGIEKVALNTQAVKNETLVRAAADKFGAQSVIVSLDVKKSILGKYEVVIEGGRKRTGIDPVRLAVKMQESGAGELLLNSVDRDGMMDGYDLKLISSVTAAVGIPVVACGGAGKLADLAAAVQTGGASASAAGSLFVFQGPQRAVMINFPSPQSLSGLFAKNS